jgi:dolichol-phosphate mannosyltransferase
MRAVVVIPTYNESATIGELVTHLIDKTFRTTDWDCYVLVVDAASPDGTAEVVRSAQVGRPSLHLLMEEKKEGLGAAYFKGFRYAEDELRADVLIEFDGDFQHPPETIPELLKQIDSGADLVLGSRWRKGGGYPKNWELSRLFFSIVGGLITRLLLFFPSKALWAVTDPTTGLKATRVEGPYRTLDFTSFLSHDFGYKIEMLFKLVRAGAKVREISLKFQTRGAGESKMTGQTPWDVFRAVFLLRWRDKPTRRFLKFASVGLSGFVVNALMLEIFVRTPVGDSIASLFSSWESDPFLGFLAKPAGWAAALAVECSIVNNFLWNNTWTFRHHRSSDLARLAARFLKFNLLSVGSIVLQFLAVGLATHALGNTMWVRQIALVLTIGLLIIPLNWFLYNKIVWRRR